MANQTSFNADQSETAEAQVAMAVMAINDTMGKMRALGERFQAASGTDQKNGNLKTQSQTAQQNSQQKGGSTVQAAEKDQLTAQDARNTYTGGDSDNAVSINTTNIGGTAP